MLTLLDEQVEETNVLEKRIENISLSSANNTRSMFRVKIEKGVKAKIYFRLCIFFKLF